MQLGEEERNRLAAKLLRAQLKGDTALAAELSKELEAAQKQAAETPTEVRLRQVKLPSSASPAPGGGKKEPAERDDDVVTLEELVRREKSSRGRPHEDEYANNIMRNSRFQNTLDYLDDHGDTLADTRRNRKGEAGVKDRQRQQQLHAARGEARMYDQCWFCLDSPMVQRNLFIASGTRTYLALPQKGVITEGHCLIIPTSHVISTLEAEEEALIEIRVRAAIVFVYCARVF